MTDPAPLTGIFTPNIVPLDERGEIHEAELRRYVSWLIDRGVHGLYPNGSTGEFTRFTAEERVRTIEIIADEVAGRVPILAGAAEANIRETLRACERYAELGVRAVAIVSPFYFKLSAGGVFAYFDEIARNAPIDVTLYNIPMFASPIDVPTVQRLSEKHERIIGIKDSSGDISHMLRMISAVRPNRPEFTFFTGWDAALWPMLMIGCNGATLGSSGAVPEVTRKIFDLVQAGRFDEAGEVQRDLLPLFDAMLATPEFPAGIRAAVESRGFDLGRSRQPQPEEPAVDAAGIKKILDGLLAKHGRNRASTFASAPRRMGA
ncbi:MAG: dihydrodipicolinate synthase family protein [Planctomycetaceae bacterium]